MTIPKAHALAFVVALVATALCALALPGSAGAGTYTVTQCSPKNPTAGQASWERTGQHYSPRNRCGTDAGLQVFHDAEQSDLGRFGAWVWRAPSGTRFTHVQANASLTNQAGHHGELVATRPDGGAVSFGSEHNDFRVHEVAGSFTQFHTWLRCAAPGPGRPCGRAGDDGAHAYVRGVYLRTADLAAPVLSLSGGSLLAEPVVRGIRPLDFSATDEGGGVRRIAVEANGTVLATDVRNCAVVDGFATALVPCPRSTSASIPVNTAHSALSTGPNAVTACVEDLAADGLPNRDCETRDVWVDNACPASAVPGGTSLTAELGAGGTGLAPSDGQGIVRGRLAGPSGPIVGATVCALTRDHVTGAPIVVGATAATGADGGYSLALPPGPSRDVFVHYVSGDRVVARHGLSLLSVARPSLRVVPRAGARRGKRLHFEGELPPVACHDRVVKVQARIGKRRWQVFRTDRADPVCRFEARYKLRATEDARAYRFRALVPQQAGYPYARGHSELVKVKVKRRRAGR